MTGGKRLRIAALFVIVLVFAFIMDMSSNAITDNTLIRNDTGDGDAVYDLVLNADGLDEDYSYQLKLKEEQPSEKQANELFTQAKKEIDDSFCEENQSVEQVRGHVIMKDAYASGAVEAEWTLSDDDLQYPAVQCVPPDGAGQRGERFGRNLFRAASGWGGFRRRGGDFRRGGTASDRGLEPGRGTRRRADRTDFRPL